MICCLCNKRILSHSQFISCSVCLQCVHISCLSDVASSDPLYTERHENSWICPLCVQDALPFANIIDDDEYADTIKTCFAGSLSPDDLALMNFNSFDVIDDNMNYSIDDVNPDLQFFNDQLCIHNTTDCNYFNEISFNKMCDDDSLNNANFSLVCHNIRSAMKNLSKLRNYLNILSHTFSIIGLTETWLNENNYEFCNLHGYSGEHAYRTERSGGGVSLFISDNIQYQRRTDLEQFCSFLESIFVEIHGNSLNSSKNSIIGIIYRPPGTDMESFLNFLNDTLGRVGSNKNIYIMGDFNINILNSESHNYTSQFVDAMYSKSLFPLINKPTRSSSGSSTLIDNIFSNNIFEQRLHSGIFYTDITDHFPVFSILSGTNMEMSNKCIKSRSFTTRNKINFRNEVNNTDFNDILQSNDCKHAFSLFHNRICQLFEKCFPLQAKTIKYANRKCYLTPGLKKSIMIKNKLYLKYKRNPTPENLAHYKFYKSKLNRIVRNQERSYFNSKINDLKGNVKKTWSVIKEVINKNKNTKINNKFLVNGEITEDRTIITNKFNDFFTNIGPNLAKEIADTDKSATDYIQVPNLRSVCLIDTTESEVARVIAGLKNSSPGWDNITADCLKSNAKVLSTILTHLINLSFSQGHFPNELKIARVAPIFKSGNPFSFSNYRPVSILPVISKVFERVIYSRLLDFLNKHKIFYEYQFGFRENHNTNLALITLVDKIGLSISKNESVLGLFLDFKKAFDTIDHNILIKKLEKYGVRGISLNLIKDYLSDRFQFVKYNDATSTRQHIKCGVPQGSILGPLLFLVYINDLPNISKSLYSIIFADDTNFFISGKNTQDLVTKMNTELIEIVKWLQCNKLSLNIDKTKFMIFSPKRQKSILSNRVKINGKELEQVSEIKFLGVILDCKLTWSSHIQKIRNKIAKSVGIICQAKKVLQKETLVTLYKAFIQPHLIYCIEIWGGTYDKYLLPLITIQKKALRIISSVPPRTHCEPLFVQCNILKLDKLYQYMIANFMFKYVKTQLPEICSGLFLNNNDVHNYNTRQKTMLHVPLTNSDVYKRTIRFAGVSVWNAICGQKFDTKCSIHTFKKKLRNHLIVNSLV